MFCEKKFVYIGSSISFIDSEQWKVNYININYYSVNKYACYNQLSL